MIFWTTFSGNTFIKGQNEEKNGGNMMYDYGLDHREIGEHFFVLTTATLCTSYSCTLGSTCIV